MSNPALRFHVHVVKSPSEDDLFQGRSESELISRAASLDNMLSTSARVISKNYFYKALNETYERLRSVSSIRLHVPILHISCHGNQNGLTMSNNDQITWFELGAALKKINERERFLIVCLSCCQGSWGNIMAMQMQAQHPFFALVGATQSPSWSETAVGFATFYHHLARGKSFQDSVSVMNAASGFDSFQLHYAEITQSSFLDYVKQNAPELLAPIAPFSGLGGLGSLSLGGGYDLVR